MPLPTKQELEIRAFQLWEADGRPDGQADHYWHLACASFEREPEKNTSPPAGNAQSRKEAATSSNDSPGTEKAPAGNKGGASSRRKKAPTGPDGASPASLPPSVRRQGRNQAGESGPRGLCGRLL
ncbi:DUF2934 domain-containing protein [Paraburkholderia sp. IW21]|uniref:DUF2934 domain-containing protein n=1 Tax=Paraburkholderia sp. IW21 TaxID=3242488 RepID=UPI003520DA15